MNMLHRVCVICAIAVLLTACGSGSDGANGTNGINGVNGVNSLVDVVPQSAGANCPSGGEKVTSGLDTNGDGVLEPSEVTSSSYVCNGITVSGGSKGLNSLVSIVPEPAGSNCSGGGEKVSSGLDTNGDGVLEASEVTATSYVCNGANGTNGTSGSNGLNSLANIVSEPAGTTCTNGGEKVTSGLDANSDGVLEASEVTSTNYVCNGRNGNTGSNGFNSLVDIVSEPIGTNCASGGKKFTSGLDVNGDGVLETSEVTATSYVCNGAPGPGITWVNVPGTAAQAQSNTGYLADNISQVLITLPASPAVGDLIQVSGIGAGGWRIAQNAGQTIATDNLEGGAIGSVWAGQDPLHHWYSVASSADGTRLVAVANGGQVYTSTDSGATWTARGPTNRNWFTVASSADGTRLVAAEYFSGFIYTSTDSGVTWTPRGTERSWTSVASSADGTQLVAATNMGDQIYTSTDAGVTWTARESNRNWLSVASSAEGTRLVAVDQGGQIYTSNDAGVTWTARDTNRNWYSVASSADGTRLVAVVIGGQIYTSSDSGVTWTARDSNRNWQSVASSADGWRLVAVANGGQIYTSTDSGVTWTPRDSNRNWRAVASSADGMRLAAGVDFGQLYTSRPTPMPSTSTGIAGSISGRQYDAIDLQYAGNGVFLVRSSAGVFNVQ
ncbi:MAG: WD40/YVTN/BNR-like repeat-containing protein [Steroidobacteraceae bacterium]